MSPSISASLRPHHRLRAEFFRFVEVHAGFNAELARLIRGGHHHRAPPGVGDYEDRFAAQEWIGFLLNRGEVSVHVDVENNPIF